MSYTTLRRFALVFVVSLVVTASSSRALDWQQVAGQIGRAAWAWLDGSALRHRVAAPKSGCSVDPLGNTHCAPITPKQGCSIDPFGKPSCPPITPKAGCSIDPQGTPRCQP
jgi:hypothetical protein